MKNKKSAKGGKRTRPIRAKKSASAKNARKKKTAKYSAEYLAVILAFVLLVQGMLMGSTQSVDWQQATDILNLSKGIEQTYQDTVVLFSPMIDFAAGVNEFYRLSAVEMTFLLDISGAAGEIGLVFEGIDGFYRTASTEMAQVLDISETPIWPAAVAGISVE